MESDVERMLAICPTYKRPEMCEDMIKSYLKTKAPENLSDMILGLSENDPCKDAYWELGKKYKISVISFDTNSTTVIFNEIWKKFPQYYCYHMTNDDVIYQTQAWDGHFIDTLRNEGGGIVYGDDQFHGAGLCTLPCISSNVLEVTGWLQYTGLDKLFGDAVWMEIGNKTPCIYWEFQTKLEHKHWINGKRDQDVTSQAYLVDYKREEFVFNVWKNGACAEVVERVKKMFSDEQLKRR